MVDERNDSLIAPHERVSERIPRGNIGSDRKRGAVMDDQEVIDRINQLANEEHELFGKESRGEASASDQQRLQRLEVSLDQCWDLLHQRRARRAAGFDPDEASVRDETTVERYVD
jgi:hypothetical protein